MTKPKTKGQKALATAMKAVKKTGAPVRLAPGPGVPCTPPVYWVESADGRRTSHKSVAAARRRLAKLRRWEEVLAAMSPKRKNKHGNNVSYDQDGKWDSDAEKRRWPILKAMQKDGQIFGLRRQVNIPLHAARKAMPAITGDVVGYYRADFVFNTIDSPPMWYFDGSVAGFNEGAVVEDVKGFRDALYKWKAKHFKAEYGFAITEVKA